MIMKQRKKTVFGIGLFVVFAFCLLIGIRYGGAAVWHFHLNALRQPMPILMYHHVVPDGEECNDMRVTPSKLREDFSYILKRGFTPVLPRELLNQEALPEKPILITFDDGYASNYELLYPLLQEYGVKVVISPIVCMPDIGVDMFCTWDMYREMANSGFVEIGSHTYALHNLDDNGMYLPNEPNGIQRFDGESDEAFETRVLEDIQKSYDRIREEIGETPVFFAYPFGAEEPDADILIDRLFPVSVITKSGTAELAKGVKRLPRWTITMEESLVNIIG